MPYSGLIIGVKMARGVVLKKTSDSILLANSGAEELHKLLMIVGLLLFTGALGSGFNVLLNPNPFWADSAQGSEMDRSRLHSKLEVIVTPKRSTWRIKSSHWQSLLDHPLVREKQHLFTLRERQLMIRAGIQKVSSSRKIWVKDKAAFRELRAWVEVNQLPFEFSAGIQRFEVIGL